MLISDKEVSSIMLLTQIPHYGYERGEGRYEHPSPPLPLTMSATQSHRRNSEGRRHHQVVGVGVGQGTRGGSWDGRWTNWSLKNFSVPTLPEERPLRPSVCCRSPYPGSSKCTVLTAWGSVPRGQGPCITCPVEEISRVAGRHTADMPSRCMGAVLIST